MEVLLPDGNHAELLIHIRSPKRRAGAATREYSRIEVCDLHPACLKILDSVPSSAKIWPSSPGVLGRRLQLALRQVIRRPGLYTLGSLRSGGATALFRRWNEDLPRLLWRGRWREPRTLGHYVQELVAARITIAFSTSEQHRVSLLSGFLGDVLDEILSVL